MTDLPNGVMSLLIDVIAEIESGGNAKAIGDRHLKNKAYGILQIRQPCMDDFNRWNGTKHKAEDALDNELLSRQVFKEYMKHYATVERLGRDVTMEDCAGCWNLGPNWFRKSPKIFEPYLKKFRDISKRMNLYV